jgi:hypothetical protein
MFPLMLKWKETYFLGRRDCAFLVCSAAGKHLKFLVRQFFSWKMLATVNRKRHEELFFS